MSGISGFAVTSHEYTPNVSAVVSSMEQTRGFLSSNRSARNGFFLRPEECRFRIALSKVPYDGDLFEVNSPDSPVELQLYGNPDGEGWICEHADFSIMAFGTSLEGAVDSFCEDLSVMWREIAQADDDSLSADAQQVKHSLLATLHVSREG